MEGEAGDGGADGAVAAQMGRVTSPASLQDMLKEEEEEEKADGGGGGGEERNATQKKGEEEEKHFGSPPPPPPVQTLPIVEEIDAQEKNHFTSPPHRSEHEKKSEMSDRNPSPPLPNKQPMESTLFVSTTSKFAPMTEFPQREDHGEGGGIKQGGFGFTISGLWSDVDLGLVRERKAKWCVGGGGGGDSSVRGRRAQKKSAPVTMRGGEVDRMVERSREREKKDGDSLGNNVEKVEKATNEVGGPRENGVSCGAEVGEMSNGTSHQEEAFSPDHPPPQPLQPSLPTPPAPPPRRFSPRPAAEEEEVLVEEKRPPPPAVAPGPSLSLVAVTVSPKQQQQQQQQRDRDSLPSEEREFSSSREASPRNGR